MRLRNILLVVSLFIIVGLVAFHTSSYYNWFEANCYNTIENASTYVQQRCGYEK